MRKKINNELTKFETGFRGSLSLVLLIILMMISLPIFPLENISDVTLNRIQYKIPVSTGHSEWHTVPADKFPWTSPEYVIGWQRRADRYSKAGIYVSLFPIKHDLAQDEYKNSLAGTLSNDYGAVLSEQSKFDFGDYEAEILKFKHSKRGNGLDFVNGNIPTTAIYFKVELEKEKAPSSIWPVLIIYCAAPTKYFSIIENEFEMFLKNFFITSPLDQNEIKELQGILDSLGFSPGAIDGMLGPQTKKAISNFQNDNNLNVNGFFDLSTLTLLKKNFEQTDSGEELNQYELDGNDNLSSENIQRSNHETNFIKLIIGNINLLILVIFLIQQIIILILGIIAFSTFKKYIKFRYKAIEKNK